MLLPFRLVRLPYLAENNNTWVRAFLQLRKRNNFFSLLIRSSFVYCTSCRTWVHVQRDKKKNYAHTFLLKLVVQSWRKKKLWEMGMYSETIYLTENTFIKWTPTHTPFEPIHTWRILNNCTYECDHLTILRW